MNKIIIKILVLILIVPLFSACTWFDNAFRSAPDGGSLTGVLLEQEAGDDFEGSHLLLADDGTEFPLKSLTLNLSGPKYLNNKVALSGDYEGEIFMVAGLSVLEILSDASVEDPKLIDYLNSDFGFSIMYYDNWELVETDDSISFLNPDGHETVVVTQFPFSYESSVFDSEQIDTPLSFYLATNYPEISDIEPLLRELGGERLEAVELEGEDGAIDYFIYRNGFMYQVAFSPSDGELDELRIFNEMIAEFGFVGFTVEVGDGGIGSEGFTDNGGYEIGAYIPDPSEMPASLDLPDLDMKFSYFESLPFSFKAKYPASWFYAGASTADSAVLRHYGFSDESVSSDNEMISLDLLSGDLPLGPLVTINGLNGVRTVQGSVVNLFVEVDGQTYKLSATANYEDLMRVMVSSIETIEIE